MIKKKREENKSQYINPSIHSRKFQEIIIIFLLSRKQKPRKEFEIQLRRSQYVLRWRLQTFGLPIGFALRVSFPTRLPRRYSRLDCRVDVELLMPVLPVRDVVGGVGAGTYQSSHSCYGVVYFSNPLLIFFLFFFPCTGIIYIVYFVRRSSVSFLPS